MVRSRDLMLNAVFMGSDAIALPMLNWLAGEGGVRFSAVFTQPDRAVGRGQKVQSNAIKQWAESRSITVHQPERVGTTEHQQVGALQPDLILVMAYGHILKQELIDIPRLGTLNLHTSILPKYRGASPIQTAVASGETETGVTLMRIVRQLDAGPVADVERVSIEALDTAAEVETKLSQACVPLVQRALPEIARGTQVFSPQVEGDATFCRRLDKADSALDFNVPAAALAARINGLNPWPGAAVEIAGQTIKIGLADVGGDANASVPVGTVLGKDDSGLLVATATGVLRLRKLQRPGGRMLAAGEFVRGFPVNEGTLLASRPMPPLVARAPFPYRKG